MKQQEGTREHLRDYAISSDATVSQLMPMESSGGHQVQMQILEQLRQVTERLDSVEDRMAVSSQHSTSRLSTNSFLESVISKPCKILSDSSSEESDTPTSEMLRSKKVDKRIREFTLSR